MANDTKQEAIIYDLVTGGVSSQNQRTKAFINSIVYIQDSLRVLKFFSNSSSTSRLDLILLINVYKYNISSNNNK